MTASLWLPSEFAATGARNRQVERLRCRATGIHPIALVLYHTPLRSPARDSNRIKSGPLNVASLDWSGWPRVAGEGYTVACLTRVPTTTDGTKTVPMRLKMPQH